MERFIHLDLYSLHMEYGICTSNLHKAACIKKTRKRLDAADHTLIAMSSRARWNCPMQSRFNFSHSYYKNFPNHFENLPTGKKKDMMSIHSNKPSRPPNRQEIVSWKQLLLRSVENTNFKKFEIAVYTGTRAIAKPNTIQSHPRDVAEDPN